jgi:uncharacterized cupredoxin-like copper-binding protein
VTRGRVASAALAVCCVAGAITLATAAPAAAPSRLLVAGKEYDLTLSRSRVAAGRVTIQLLNRGEDDHDLRLRRVTSKSGAPVARWALTSPGEVTDLTVRLSRGRYRLWCSLPGHRELGMRATLRVVAGVRRPAVISRFLPKRSGTSHVLSIYRHEEPAIVRSSILPTKRA